MNANLTETSVSKVSYVPDSVYGICADQSLFRNCVHGVLVFIFIAVFLTLRTWHGCTTCISGHSCFLDRDSIPVGCPQVKVSPCILSSLPVCLLGTGYLRHLLAASRRCCLYGFRKKRLADLAALGLESRRVPTRIQGLCMCFPGVAHGQTN